MDIYNPPEHFKTEEEKEVWNQTLNIMEENGILKKSFLNTAEIYCSQLLLYRKAMKKTRKRRTCN